ncbi:MAG: DNA polymerase III subunit gamma/tau [Chloroflexota bacterium]
MTSQVFYRKWRPQTFTEVSGQEHVTQTLRNAISAGRIAHAYLFCGPRGTGKTSTGRILAKAVNCLSLSQGEPCGKCEVCQAFAEGRLLDVIEIDAASNRGIDEIRDLRQKVNYAPGIARYKVYIIDEVHMLTEQASNALLKTLEEPPSHTIFILATTEPHKVLPTILSRCQRFDFRRIAQSAVVKRLELIAEKEGITIPAEGLRLVARAATGSLRDAANLLEQLIAYYGKNIEFTQVREMLGVTGDARIKELAKQVLDRDTAASLRTVASVNRDGLDLRQFNRELVQYFRGLLLVKSGSEEAVDVTAEDLAEMKGFVALVTPERLLKVVRIFNDADLRLDSYSALPLELAVVESTVSEEKAPVTRMVKPVEAPKPAEASPARPVRPESPRAAAVPPVKSAAAEPPTMKPAEPKSVEDQVKPTEQVKTLAEGQLNIEYLKLRWKDFVESLRGVGSSGNMDAVLRSACQPVEIEGDTITLAFYWDFHKAKIEDPKYRFLVEKKLAEVFGQPYRVKCVLREKAKKESSNSGEDNYMAKAAMKMGARIVNKRPIVEGQ